MILCECVFLFIEEYLMHKKELSEKQKKIIRLIVSDEVIVNKDQGKREIKSSSSSELTAPSFKDE